jgi:hypothetical protein
MCAYQSFIRGITICGRRVYATDTGVKVGFAGPTCSLDEACADLNEAKASYLRNAWTAIARKQSVAAAALTTQPASVAGFLTSDAPTAVVISDEDLCRELEAEAAADKGMSLEEYREFSEDEGMALRYDRN